MTAVGRYCRKSRKYHRGKNLAEIGLRRALAREAFVPEVGRPPSNSVRIDVVPQVKMRQTHQQPLENRHVRREGLFRQHRSTAEVAHSEVRSSSNAFKRKSDPQQCAACPSPGDCRLSRRGEMMARSRPPTLFGKAFHIKGNDDLSWVSLTYALQVF